MTDQSGHLLYNLNDESSWEEMDVTEKENVILEDRVRKDWVDYNGHMNDSAYAFVFSIAVDRLMRKIGIDSRFRRERKYSMYTLETHLCYLRETLEAHPFRVTLQLLDYDDKRLHVFFVMENDDGVRLATSEQMLIGIDMTLRRSAPFPPPVMERIEALAKHDRFKPKPEEAGRVIGIKGK